MMSRGVQINTQASQASRESGATHGANLQVQHGNAEAAASCLYDHQIVSDFNDRLSGAGSP
jgi:hypothetical protein